MSETKFTKGPWIVKDGVVVCTNPSDSYTRVAYAYSGHATPYTEEVLNNAHLIASAPEMYEILERLVDPSNCKKDIIHIIGNAESLLAKARGEK